MYITIYTVFNTGEGTQGIDIAITGVSVFY